MLVRRFPAWGLPFDLFFNPSTWRFVGSDLLPSMRADPRVQRGLASLAGATDELIVALSDLAALNEKRTGDAFRTIAVAYVTLPIAMAALVSEAAPDFTRSFILDNAGRITPIIAALVLTPIVYFCGHCRAKQIAWTFALLRAQARLAQSRATEQDDS